MITYAIALTVFLGNGSVIQATSLPQSWPTMQACEQAAAEDRPTFLKEHGFKEEQVRTHCFPAIVDDDNLPLPRE